MSQLSPLLFAERPITSRIDGAGAQQLAQLSTTILLEAIDGRTARWEKWVNLHAGRRKNEPA